VLDNNNSGARSAAAAAGGGSSSNTGAAGGMSSSSSNKKSTTTENAVTVGVRIRPMSDKELTNSQCYFAASADATNVQELDEFGMCQKNWSYDHVFGPDCSNQYIFHSVGTKLVDAALEGYNTVLFMYGQTASGRISAVLCLLYFIIGMPCDVGKTFTLFGDDKTMGCVGHAIEYG
jgi:hypothetical protein